jgi:hypothetical protein
MKTLKSRLKTQFSYDVSGLGVYVDEQSDEIFTDLIYGSGLTSRINVMEEVKGSKEIKLLNVDFDLQLADSCTLSDDGTVTFTDKALATKRVGVQFSLCNENLNDTWAQMLLAIGANRQDRDMPLEDVITAYVVKKARKKNQDLMFKGDTTSLDDNLNIYDGFIKLFMNDASIVVATRTGATITAANGFDNALSVYNAIPGEVHDNEIPVELITGRTEARAILAQIWDDKDYNALVDFTDVNGEISFVLPTTNVTVRSYPQLDGRNQIFGVPYMFMFFGTDLEADMDGFFARYLEDSENIRFGAKWRSGIQWVYEQYFVRLAIAAS